MKRLLYIYVVILISCVHISCAQATSKDVVTVLNRQILLNGNPYLIKGVCYNPVPKGSNRRDFSDLSKDLELMKEAGINTIRVYSPIIEETFLDKIHDAGIRVIVNFGYNQDGNYDILTGSFIDYINQYKNHPAILFWELGNEYNYHPEWFDNDIKNWYRAMNNAAEIIHQNDSNHPVATAYGELPDSTALALGPAIDIWGINVYRWDDPGEIFEQWRGISTKPMYLSETGADSYMTAEMKGYKKGENQKAQADAIRNILEVVFNHRDVCAGVTLFEFSDEWWKAGNINAHDQGGRAPRSSGVPYDGAPNEEYWGIVNVDRTKKLAFETVKNIYRNISEPEKRIKQ